jgi:hypothetical protein
MRFNASACVCLALLLFGAPAGAQETGEQEPKTWEEEASSYFVLEEVLMRGSDDPTLKSPLAVPQPKLILETKDGETIIKARIGMEMQKRFMLDLQVSSPTNTSGNTTLASLDGLSDGSSAEVGFSWILWPEEKTRLMLKDAQRKMAEAGVRRNMSEAEHDEAMRLYTDPKVSIPARPSAVAALGPTLYKRALEESTMTLQKNHPPVFLTARAKVGQQEFHFVDEETLESDDQTHAGHEFTASVGAYMRGKFYIATSYRGGREFTAKRKANICSPFEETDSLECRDVVLGAPTERATEKFDIEIRRLFGTLGFQARLSRDLRENITFVEVPVYFLQKLGLSDMELNGGVAVKWQSDTDDFSISAFIGPSLSTVFRMNGR